MHASNANITTITIIIITITPFYFLLSASFFVAYAPIAPLRSAAAPCGQLSYRSAAR